MIVFGRSWTDLGVKIRQSDFFSFFCTEICSNYVLAEIGGVVFFSQNVICSSFFLSWKLNQPVVHFCKKLMSIGNTFHLKWRIFRCFSFFSPSLHIHHKNWHLGWKTFSAPYSASCVVILPLRQEISFALSTWTQDALHTDFRLPHLSNQLPNNHKFHPRKEQRIFQLHYLSAYIEWGLPSFLLSSPNRVSSSPQRSYVGFIDLAKCPKQTKKTQPQISPSQLTNART